MKYLWATVAMAVALGVFFFGTDLYVQHATKHAYGFSKSLWRA